MFVGVTREAETGLIVAKGMSANTEFDIERMWLAKPERLEPAYEKLKEIFDDLADYLAKKTTEALSKIKVER